MRRAISENYGQENRTCSPSPVSEDRCRPKANALRTCSSPPARAVQPKARRRRNRKNRKAAQRMHEVRPSAAAAGHQFERHRLETKHIEELKLRWSGQQRIAALAKIVGEKPRSPQRGCRSMRLRTSNLML